MKIIQFILLSLIVTFSSCGGDDNASGESSCDNKNATISANYNGSSLEFDNVQRATIFKGEDVVTGTGVEGYRLDLSITAADGTSLYIIVNEFEDGVSGDCMNVGKTWSTLINSQEIVVFTLTTPDGLVLSSFGEDFIGSFKFTNCEESRKSISGEFDVDFGSDGTITNGKFSDVCFTNI